MTRQESAARITDLLVTLRRARDPKREPRNELAILPDLKRWQSRRLEHAFADLTRQPRFTAAARFFLDDLYSEHDVSWRDRDMTRMLPTLRAWLPETVLDTVAKALELDLLSHELDLAVAHALTADSTRKATIDDAAYARAYRAAGRRRDRERQLELLLFVGKELERIVKKPLVFAMLRFARGPAQAAGLGKLQGFLERGFAAFKAMGSADEFLDAIRMREHELMRRLFGGHPSPFDLGKTTEEQGERRRPKRRRA